MATNEGELKVVGQPPQGVTGNLFDYLPCCYCYGFEPKGEMYRHVGTCECASKKKKCIPEDYFITAVFYFRQTKRQKVVAKIWLTTFCQG